MKIKSKSRIVLSRLLVILLLFFCATVVLLFRPQNQLIDAEQEDISIINVDFPSINKTVKFEKKDNNWVSSQFPFVEERIVNQIYISSILQYLTEPHSGRFEIRSKISAVESEEIEHILSNLNQQEYSQVYATTSNTIYTLIFFQYSEQNNQTAQQYVLVTVNENTNVETKKLYKVALTDPFAPLRDENSTEMFFYEPPPIEVFDFYDEIHQATDPCIGKVYDSIKIEYDHKSSLTLKTGSDRVRLRFVYYDQSNPDKALRDEEMDEISSNWAPLHITRHLTLEEIEQFQSSEPQNKMTVELIVVAERYEHCNSGKNANEQLPFFTNKYTFDFKRIDEVWWMHAQELNTYGVVTDEVVQTFMYEDSNFWTYNK